MLTWGKLVGPLSPPPPTTTSGWAAELVDPALNGALKALGGAPGVETYLRQLLGLDPTAPFQMAWRGQVPTNQPLPELLLTARLGGTGRIGIFTEPSWLALHPNISSRGTGVYHSLFATEVPPPPPGTTNTKLDPSLPDRVALEQSLSQPVCAACHNLIDQPGFALGHFAADGTYRDQDHGLPIDTTGTFGLGQNQINVGFDGIEDFGLKALQSCATTFGVADGFLRAALVINNAPQDARERLFQASQWQVRQGFRSGQQTYAALLRAYIQSPAGLNP
ncbi:MAG TPA: DUF1588 domain-containing protein [Polyangiaceae bacterium]|nr:DUF1588 domain-containing protein [Polyangiaceae bacterium]